MAKGSATEARMGSLHDKVARVFEKVLATYEARLDEASAVDLEKVEADVLDVLLQNSMPNPAMMGAVTKFLKDNSIEFDSEQVAKLSATEERLAERRKKRTSLESLTTDLRVVSG